MSVQPQPQETRSYTVRVVSITPQLAEEMLGRMARNRPIDPATVQRYVAAMLDGRWHSSTDAIGFDTDGNLINGQHRLTAIIESGMTIEMLVAENVPAEMMPLIDRGRPRTNANSLHIAGFENAGVLAPFVKLIYQYENMSPKNKSGIGAATHLDDEVLIGRITSDPAIIVAAAFVDTPEMRDGLRGIAKLHHAALVHYMGSKTSPEKVVPFLTELASGENLQAGSPVLALRKQMINQVVGHRMPATQTLALLIRAWNAYEDGRNISKVQWRKSREEFPRFRKFKPGQ